MPLDPPLEGSGGDGHGGLGLRRVQWTAHSLNERSIVAAKRLGFVWEGILRWHLVLPARIPGNGKPAPEGEEEIVREAPGRDSAMLSLCWDDWETQRDKVIALMERR